VEVPRGLRPVLDQASFILPDSYEDPRFLQGFLACLQKIGGMERLQSQTTLYLEKYVPCSLKSGDLRTIFAKS
jgi:hypothetical protein